MVDSITAVCRGHYDNSISAGYVNVLYNFTEKYADLSDKKFIFIFKEYAKTF